jgi:hypothetical protein
VVKDHEPVQRKERTLSRAHYAVSTELLGCHQARGWKIYSYYSNVVTGNHSGFTDADKV